MGKAMGGIVHEDVDESHAFPWMKTAGAARAGGIRTTTGGSKTEMGAAGEITATGGIGSGSESEKADK